MVELAMWTAIAMVIVLVVLVPANLLIGRWWNRRMSYREMFFVGGGHSYPVMELCSVVDDRYIDPNPHFRTYVVLTRDPDWVNKVING